MIIGSLPPYRDDIPKNRHGKFIDFDEHISCPNCGKIGEYVGIYTDVPTSFVFGVWFDPLAGHWKCSNCFRSERPVAPLFHDRTGA